VFFAKKIFFCEQLLSSNNTKLGYLNITGANNGICD